MKTVLIAGLLAAAMAAPVHAHEPTTETKGPYVGFGLTSVDHEWLDDRKTLGKLFVGYNVNDRWGMEFGLRQRSEFDFSYSDPLGNGAHRSTMNGRSMYVAGKFTAQIVNRLSFQTKLGVSHNTGRVHFITSGIPGPFIGRDSSNGLYASIGLKYQLTDKLAMTLEMERNGKRTYSGEKRDTVSLNASYSF